MDETAVRGIEFACGLGSTVAIFCRVDGMVFDRLGNCVSRMVLCNYCVESVGSETLFFAVDRIS